MKRIAIIGYSGHAFVVLDACKKMGLQVDYYCEQKVVTHRNPYQLAYLGDESSAAFDWDKIDGFVLGIGENTIRSKVAALILKKGKKLIDVVHPTAVVNDFVTIGSGTFLASNTVINPLATIGQSCIINTGTIVEHECQVGHYVHLAPGVVLAGNIAIGDNTFVGANSVVKQGISIGENVIVGAGSVVVKSIPDNETWMGNPARKYN